MKVWLVQFEPHDDVGDLDAVFSSREKAIEYIQGEMERCEWVDLQLIEENEQWSSYQVYSMPYEKGIGLWIDILIIQHTVDEKPYFLK